MATCTAIGAEIPTKSDATERQSIDITVNFGIFFDGTNNHRLQVAMGKLNRAKNADKQKEIIIEKIKSLDGTFDEEQFKKNGIIKYSLKVDASSDQGIKKLNSDQGIKKLNEAIAEYNEKYGNRLDDNERDLVNSFAWDKASGEKKEDETNTELLKKKKKKIIPRIGTPQTFMQNVDFTNIARLEPMYSFSPKDSSSNKFFSYRVYVEGSGTFANVDKGKDYTGLSTGQQSAGVVQKVKDALDAIKDEIKKINNNDDINNVDYKFNVFGFSRGATEARLFVDLCSPVRANNRGDILESIITDYNRQFGLSSSLFGKHLIFPKQLSIEFPFVGLFDTVSSVGVIESGIWNPKIGRIGRKVERTVERVFPVASDIHERNKADLGLDSLVYDDNVKHIVHICALDEYRENFALQVLPISNPKVEQFFIPGIHTDIGGGDLEGYDIEEKYIAKTRKKERLFIPKIVSPGEKQKTPDNQKDPNLLEISYDNLQKLGWIKDVKDGSLMSDKDGSLMSDIVREDEDVIIIQRFSEHGYSFLPLTIMAKKASTNTCVFNELESKYSIPGRLPKDFVEMKSLWKGKKSKYGYCYYPTNDNDYKLLRQRYLHFSSNIKEDYKTIIVNGPNLAKSTPNPPNKECVSYYDRFLDYYHPKGWYGRIEESSITNIKFEEAGNQNNDDYLGEAVVIFQDSRVPLVKEDTNPAEQLDIDKSMGTFEKYGYSIESGGVLKKIAVGRITPTNNTIIYGTNGKIQRFNGITTPYDETKWNTILEGNYKAKQFQMTSNGIYTKQVNDNTKECKTYLISKENGDNPDGTKNGKTIQMTGVYLHRSDGGGIAYKRYIYKKGDKEEHLQIGSSMGCLVIDQRQYADVELLLGDSQDIFISINRT